jgi:hypothetical protein
VKSSSPRIARSVTSDAGAGQFRDFIDAFDLNRRGVHIHHQQPGVRRCNFTQRRDVQPRLMRQSRRTRRQRARQADHLVIFDHPGGDDHQRGAQLTLPRRQTAFIQTASYSSQPLRPA